MSNERARWQIAAETISVGLRCIVNDIRGVHASRAHRRLDELSTEAHNRRHRCRSEPCTNASAGVIVERGGLLLLLERRWEPLGFACPAGHVDPGETPLQAAHRELREETGLVAPELTLALETRVARHNTCSHPGGTWHQWSVYTHPQGIVGEPVCDPEEAGSSRWVNRSELDILAARTRAYLAGLLTDDQWSRSPGLEPVWVDILTRTGWIHGDLVCGQR